MATCTFQEQWLHKLSTYTGLYGLVHKTVPKAYQRFGILSDVKRAGFVPIEEFLLDDIRCLLNGTTKSADWSNRNSPRLRSPHFNFITVFPKNSVAKVRCAALAKPPVGISLEYVHESWHISQITTGSLFLLFEQCRVVQIPDKQLILPVNCDTLSEAFFGTHVSLELFPGTKFALLICSTAKFATKLGLCSHSESIVCTSLWFFTWESLYYPKRFE